MQLICFLNFNQTGKKDQISQPKNYSNSEVFWTQPHTFAQVKLFLNSKSSSLHSFPTTIVYVKHRGRKAFLLWQAGKSIGCLTTMPLDSCRSKVVPRFPLQTIMQLLWEKNLGSHHSKGWGDCPGDIVGSSSHLAARTLRQQSRSRCATGIWASQLQSTGFGPHARACTEILAHRQTTCKPALTSAEAEHD